MAPRYIIYSNCVLDDQTTLFKMADTLRVTIQWTHLCCPGWESSIGTSTQMFTKRYFDLSSRFRIKRATGAGNDKAVPLQWRHNGLVGVSNDQPNDCLLNRLFRHRWKENQSSESLAFVRGIYRWPVNSPHKVPVTRKMFPFDDAIMPGVKYLLSHLAF